MRPILHLLALLLALTAGPPLLAVEPAPDAEDAPVETPIDDIDREHWAFQPVADVLPPRVQNVDWCRTPVDRFVLAKLEEAGLSPMPEADRLTLLRRVTYDLTGLPPMPEDIAALRADTRPGAYERAVERLLASPAYGERWAQHWLDLARFAETDGFEFDSVRPEAWRYRDWVIHSLNADLPYDRFVSAQLAGDQLAPNDVPALIATGFLLCGPDMPDINDAKERRHVFLNGLTATVGEVLLGLQFGCAQCHDHKTDPISQYDFYRLRAFFEPIDLFQGRRLPVTDDLPAQTAAGAGGDRKQAEPAVMRVAQALQSPPPGRLWIRGDFRRAGPEVQPRVPRVLTPAGEQPVGGDRRDLAAWLFAPQNPATARVIVNRLWQHHFGRGLAAMSSDFGYLGREPTHPELLDWLAGELRRREWSLKAIHRLLVTSAVYRTASRPLADGGPSSHSAMDAVWRNLVESDPENELLGRMRRRRLDGEEIRDALLATSGRLNRVAGGPGVRPPLPPEVVATLLKNQWPVTENSSDHVRRSIYLFSRRNLKYPLFEVFDKPDSNQSCPQRSQTTIAPQALHLLNSGFVRECAADLASAIDGPAAPQSAIDSAWLTTLGRPPTAAEQQAARSFVESGTADAWSDLCLALFNLSEFLVVD